MTDDERARIKSALAAHTAATPAPGQLDPGQLRPGHVVLLRGRDAANKARPWAVVAAAHLIGCSYLTCIALTSWRRHPGLDYPLHDRPGFVGSDVSRIVVSEGHVPFCCETLSDADLSICLTHARTIYKGLF